MEQLNKDQAIVFSNQNKWEEMTISERACFQIQQDRLCMPFNKFHEAVEKTLGRPVWTHEFGMNRNGIMKELLENGEAPSFEDIVAIIPTGKTILMVKT